MRFLLLFILAVAPAAQAQPFDLTQILTASDAGVDQPKDYGGQEFGSAVAVSGDVAIVGSRFDTDAETFEEGGYFVGAAYVFERDPATGLWAETQKLLPESPEPIGTSSYYFGTSVALSGGLALIGTNGEKVHAFERDSATGLWTETQKFISSDCDPSDLLLCYGDRFGSSVAIEGNLALVGAFRNRIDGSATQAPGAVYFFKRDATTGLWTETQKRRADPPIIDGYFGFSVALSGTTALVGANGLESQVYDFEYDAATETWSQVQQLTSSRDNRGVEFGYSVALSGDHAIVGAPGDFADPKFTDLDDGAAYVFEHDTATELWNEVAVLTGDDVQPDREFGFSVAIDGNTALVGARFEKDEMSGEGAAYFFERDATGIWTKTQKFVPEAEGRADEFGTSVALSGGVALVGGPQILEENGHVHVFEAPGVTAGEPGPAPGFFSLSSVYPNPSTHSAHFSLEVEAAQHVTMEVFDTLGRRTSVLYDGRFPAGMARSFTIERAGLSSGVYFVRISGETFSILRKVTLTR